MSTPGTTVAAAPAGVAALSALPQAEFVGRLADIFEHSPWVPERAWAARPFDGIDALHAAMVAAVDHATEAEQLALICAHPELAGREAARPALGPAPEPADPSPGPEEEAARADLLDHLYQTLPPRHARLLELTFWRDCTDREIAGELGMDVGRVRDVRRRLVEKMRDDPATKTALGGE